MISLALLVVSSNFPLIILITKGRIISPSYVATLWIRRLILLFLHHGLHVTVRSVLLTQDPIFGEHFLGQSILLIVKLLLALGTLHSP